MRILGVDPGSLKTGVGIIDVQGNRIRHVHHSVIRCGAGDFDDRLHILFSGLKLVIAEFHPTLAAIEDVFVSKNVNSALKLGQARGALIAACTDSGLRVSPYSPTKVKQAVVGFGRADKEQVQHMIRILLHPPEPLAEDAADALAVAICHAHHAPMQTLTGTLR
ncbi:crossover junction endodeoxyribonuclease RuvC [Mariprofundus ferrooxydans]|uniref:Crossover junction endodeoxyribonuclease RuvC n=1 Tax=Mariprofundus ferrooxydans PV-1 TaxID=314345 RepID=Q0F2I7_9PROT|nr:crossover junction endodeoxyribonuclease RuvC [Mariprofundus ferrooxydans]EAU55563.1 Crossover junction endodeoxyribonuclease RuvC [Mariprofundus ferrooxydans PV-1]KON48696.1 crossover junction endodeoxyribonuclease RuvC [Mariprofundus ferrooxydans]